MLFKVRDIRNQKTYTVYAVSRNENAIMYALFLVYDEDDG